MWVSNSQLSRHWKLDEPAAMRLPSVMLQVGLSGFGFTTNLCRRIAFERSMKTVVVVIILERFKLTFQINSVPEQRLVKKLTTNGSDQALNKWMGNGSIRDAFDGVNFNNTKVRLPSVILEKWIVVRA